MPTSLQSNGVGTFSVLASVLPPHEVLYNPGIEGLFMYEDDPFHYLNHASVDEALKKKAFVAVCDALPTFAVDYAHVTVPTGTFAEKEGTYVAEDGFVRKVTRARGTVSPGFEFLRALLHKLGGGLCDDEKELTANLYAKQVFVTDESGKGRLGSGSGQTSFIVLDAVPEEAQTQTLVLRNIFFSHHLSDKAVYAKMVHVNNPPIAGNKLFISPEDAHVLGISDGEKVVLESGHGSFQERVSVKEGLKKGVFEYRMLRNRQDVLQLSSDYKKHIPVTVKKV